jgi:6-phosphogluconate dehydrogenase
MQMIAEVYGILRDGLGMSAKDIGGIFARWNGGRLNSFLIEITAKVLATEDEKTGLPLVDVIVDRAGQKGTGRWSVIEAQMLGVPASAIEAAVAARSLSSMKAERETAEAVYAIANSSIAGTAKEELGRHLEAALYAGKIAAYAQGFAIMENASAEFGWKLPLAGTARIWRAGCIIRSRFLGLIANAFDGTANRGNLLLAADFVTMMKDTHGALRHTVAAAALAGLPVPALSSALSYFDSYRQSRGTANLIQGQRDFFGAHGFERIGEPGSHHGVWR